MVEPERSGWLVQNCDGKEIISKLKSILDSKSYFDLQKHPRAQLTQNLIQQKLEKHIKIYSTPAQFNNLEKFSENYFRITNNTLNKS